MNEVVSMITMRDFMSAIKCKLQVVNRDLEYSQYKVESVLKFVNSVL